MKGRRQPLPKEYINRPKLSPFLAFYWESFNKLSTCRQVEGGRIPWTAINDFCWRNKIEDIDFFERVISEMDNTLLEHHRKEREANERKNKHR